jgi:signal transduction histidine kinase
MDKNTLHFRISTGLKDLLGQDLITNEFIAVFELVKNSYDANSKEVYIIFEQPNTPFSKIKIIDKGKGMNNQDLIEKWLFVAYSAKKEGIEDQNSDYRDNLKSKRYYAGAKGVGRFSCDRLGRKLNLYSIKNEKNATIESIEVDWNNFELDSKVLFKDIPIKNKTLHELPKEYQKYDISHGTILEISLLRDDWNRQKILDLKTSLAKLILPQFNNKNQENSFKILVEAESESQKDNTYINNCKTKKSNVDYKKIVNGPVVNFIFETLNLKTTQISSEISEDGQDIITTLTDRGQFIYKLTEDNESNLLSNISIQIYFLNRAAKWNFTNKMNTEPVNYGNLFMYKNGFRIHPYGKPRDDSYGIDARKAQGHSRYLGTRDIIGKIEIKGDNSYLRETTSRDGGLIKNSSFNQLLDFLKTVLLRLEKYVRDAKEWGVDDESLKDLKDGNSEEGIVKLLSNISKDKKIKKITYNEDIANILNVHEEKSAKRLARNFKRIAQNNNNPELEQKAIELENKILSLQKAKKEAEKAKKEAEKQHKEDIKSLKKENKYLLAVSKDLSPEAIGLVHHISHKLSQTLPKIDSLIKKINKGKLKDSELKQKLSEIKLNTEKIEKISRLVIRSNFNLMVSEEKGDLIEYIEEYISLYNEINESVTTIEVQFQKNDIDKFDFLFSKINISLILDNLLNNSKKAKANKALIIFEKGPKKSLRVVFSDNGIGVDKSIEKSLFNIGITTTSGSGVGLFTNNKLMSEMGASLSFLGNGVHEKGASFELIF